MQHLLRTVVCVALGIFSVALQAQTRRALLIGIGHYAPPQGVQLTVASGHALDSRFEPGASWIDLHGPAIDVARMQVLLREKYGFTDIRLLPEQQATRAGILASIDRLIADTKTGDLDVFYYSGHGSQRKDTLSSKNSRDQTIVPIDAWRGIEDVRDKELAFRFDKIVYEKNAHLTAIFDSCDSATMARGITASVQRALPYDDRDVAVEKTKDPTTITEEDLKQIPQTSGRAIIIAAAARNESAVEALYPDDHQWHGAFTRALVRVLESTTQTLSADDVVAQVSNMLHADPVPFQQPSVEGQASESLFGEPIAAHALHVSVLKVAGDEVTIDMGSAAGFDAGTQFIAANAAPDGKKTVLEVVGPIDEPLNARAKVIEAASKVKVGDPFEMSKETYPRAARLVIFSGTPVASAKDATKNARSSFPNLRWVDDPATAPVDFLVVQREQSWVAYDQRGNALGPGVAVKGTAFLLLGPSPSLKQTIEQTVPFQRQAFSFDPNIADADYLLARRLRADGTSEYALLDPAVLAPHAVGLWVASAETDPDDAALNGGKQPDVVCRNDISLPVRTAWLPETESRTQSEGAKTAAIVVALNRRIVRLGKLRVWMQTAAMAPGIGGWPYRLALSQPGGKAPIGKILHNDDHYDIRLVTSAQQRAAATVTPKYVYVFGFDCAANQFLLYPPQNLNGGGTVPQPGDDGVFPLDVKILTEGVGEPFGADTVFMMATKEPVMDPQILLVDGVLDRGAARGSTNRFEELLNEMSDAGTRGPRTIPDNWAVQQLVVPSRP